MIGKCSLITVLLWILAVPVFAAENLDAWNYSAPINFEGSNKYKAFYLTEEIYEHALPGLADIRIVDAKGEYVPFYIQNGSNSLRENTIIYKSEIVQKLKKNNDSYIDFAIIPLKNNIDITGNSLIFALPSGNFLKHIDIYGGNDGNSWDYIGKDYVFRAEGREKNKVSIGNKRKYTYYRIVVLDNPEDIALEKMNLSNNYTDNQWNNFIKTAEVAYDVKTEKSDSILTIANKQRLTIKQVILEVESDFQRNYTVFSGENPNGTILKSGEIYNLQLENVKVSGAKIDFGNNPISTPTINIKIDNRDDRPLTIKSISIEYYVDKLVFPDVGNTPYQLCFGNEKATKPKYEIELQKAYIEKEQHDSCSLGAIQVKAKEMTAPSSFNMKYVFNGIIVAISLLMIVVLITRLGGKK